MSVSSLNSPIALRSFFLSYPKTIRPASRREDMRIHMPRIRFALAAEKG
jgi:hypothetical protein